MINQKLQLQDSSAVKQPQVDDAISLVPISKTYFQNYVVYRVKLKPIEISQSTRDDILLSLSENKRFIQVGEFTLMLNSIASIEPIPIINKQRAEKYSKMKEKFTKDFWN